MPSDEAHLWRLDPAIDFLNHGSFGACPVAVLEEQARLRAVLEAEPVAFFARRLPELFDYARTVLGRFLGADPEGLVAVTNATTGVNTVLRSLAFRAGDELLVTDHGYNACRNAVERVAAAAGARVVVVRIPFPGTHPQRVIERVLGAVTSRTCLALLDHVTSPTGLVLPIGTLVAELASRGVETLVDGAHAPGMVDLDLDGLGAAYYTGNAHKWLCAPKGAAFLHVREDLRDRVRPLVTSHGVNTRRPGRSAFHDEFDWTGTHDPTPFLSIPAAIEHLATAVAGGWSEIRRRNRSLALEARELLCAALGVEAPADGAMVGSLASVPLPDATGSPIPPPAPDPLQEALFEEERFEVPVVAWPAPPRRLLRISAQLYNERAQYQRLARVLAQRLAGRQGILGS